MVDHLVTFNSASKPVSVPTGTLLSDAARQAGVDLLQPCGGQGRCGRCAVQVTDGTVRRRSTMRLTEEDIALGYALACQTIVEGNASIWIPPQEKIERRLSTDRTAAEVCVPPEYHYRRDQALQRVFVQLNPPSMEDQTDDFSRLKTALRLQYGYSNVGITLSLLRKIGRALREGDWQATAIVYVELPSNGDARREWLVDLLPGRIAEDAPLWSAAIDIGTTTVSLWLVDLISGDVKAQVSEYNGQIARGEDVISRIVYASKGDGAVELRALVLETIQGLLEIACKRVGGLSLKPGEIVRASIAGNSTMMHLILGIPAESIRLSPFITAANEIPLFRSKEVGLGIHPNGIVDCLPGVASYVGADITAGVLSSGMDETEKVTLFMDVGTNGEIVLGSREWLVTCACSAGPAFEGAGVKDGMRATRGAIEEVWINGENFEPSYRVIGGGRPKGICGSGLISLLAEAFMTGLVDKGGNINSRLNSQRVREGEHGWEYVVTWGSDTDHGRDIVFTHVDIDNLVRAKAAIFAGYSVLADSVGISMDDVEQMLIGGSFGKYINVEKAVQIGLLPDLPWEKFQFLGNTSVKGAYFALLDRKTRERLKDIASRMTYIELSADNSFYEAFMSALFLPHTDLSRFPSVEALLPEAIQSALQ